MSDRVPGIYAALERGIVGIYAVFLALLTVPVLERFGWQAWESWPPLMAFTVALLALLWAPAKFPLLLIAGIQALAFPVFGPFRLTEAFERLYGDPDRFVPMVIASWVLPLPVILVCKENGPFGNALLRRAAGLEGSPRHHRVGLLGGLVVLLAMIAAPLVLLAGFGGVGGSLILPGLYLAAAIAGVLLVRMSWRSFARWRRPAPELPPAARRISVQQRVRKQPQTRHLWTIGDS